MSKAAGRLGLETRMSGRCCVVNFVMVLEMSCKQLCLQAWSSERLELEIEMGKGAVVSMAVLICDTRCPFLSE